MKAPFERFRRLFWIGALLYAWLLGAVSVMVRFEMTPAFRDMAGNVMSPAKNFPSDMDLIVDGFGWGAGAAGISMLLVLIAAKVFGFHKTGLEAFVSFCCLLTLFFVVTAWLID